MADWGKKIVNLPSLDITHAYFIRALHIIIDEHKS